MSEGLRVGGTAVRADNQGQVAMLRGPDAEIVAARTLAAFREPEGLVAPGGESARWLHPAKEVVVGRT